MDESPKIFGNIVRGNNGQYLYICYYCNETFNSGPEIEKHIDEHLGIDNNEQEVSPNAFSNANENSIDEFDNKFETLSLIEFKSEVNLDENLMQKVSDDGVHNLDLDVEISAKKYNFNEYNTIYPTNSLFIVHAKTTNELYKKIPISIQPRPIQLRPIQPKPIQLKLMQQQKPMNQQNNGEKILKKFNCTVCNKGLTTKTKLKYHLEKMHTVTLLKPKFQCSYCKKQFTKENSMKKHINHHMHKKQPQPKLKTKPKIFKCNLCENRIFKHNYLLQTHLDRHNNYKKFKCDICSALYNSKKTLSSHINDKHTNNIYLSFTCEICGISVKNKANIKKHIENVHQKVNVFSCKLCNVSFSYKWSLIYHMRSHTGERPYQCDQCGKEFITTSSISVHMKVQHSTTTHNCHLCNKTFAAQIRLKKHLKTHINERLYQCEICGNYFKSAQTLRNHKYIHNSEKKYQCQFCDQKFSQSSGKRSHIRIVHNVI